MPFSLIQSGSALQTLSTTGAVTTLTLPTGVTLSTASVPRWAVYGNYAIMVNTPSTPLSIDAVGTVRPLVPKAPKLAPVLSAGTAGTLTGNYRARFTFVIEDAVGNIIAESDFSPTSNQVSITASQLQATGIELSSETITKRRLYRTTDNGAVYFPWVDLDGNTLTQVQDDVSDAGLSLIAASVLGSPPQMTRIAEFRARLFGVGDTLLDTLRYTEAGVPYAWPADNTLVLPSSNGDAFGISALVPRRDALGVGRRNLLAQVTGTGSETQGIVDLDVVILSRELGVESQESAQVFRDTAYFLWKDGVYTWNSSGITCISDGRKGTGVRAWFATDSYFNRDMFPFAFAHIDSNTYTYRLFLASAGSTIIDRWVEFNIQDQLWFGPHKTDLFTPVSAFRRLSSANRFVPVIGGTANVYNDQTTRTDGTATAIALDVIGKRHAAEDPDQEKYFGEISILGRPQTLGTLVVETLTGTLDATQMLTQRSSLVNARQRLGRLGRGKHAQVRLKNADVGADVEIFGYEIDPVNTVGRR